MSKKKKNLEMDQLVYLRCLAAGEKRKYKPIVHHIDWNYHPQKCDGAKNVLACATSKGTRIWRINTNAFKCTLLYNRAAPEGRQSLVCKWNPHDGAVIATGGDHLAASEAENTTTARTGGIIRLLRYTRGDNDGHFEDIKSFKVGNGEDVSQLSWAPDGKYLLATVNLREKLPAKLYIINIASRRRIVCSQVIEHPVPKTGETIITAKFADTADSSTPSFSSFISVAGSNIWVWSLDMRTFTWHISNVLDHGCSTTRLEGKPPLICFQPHGHRLATFGGDHHLRIFRYGGNGEETPKGIRKCEDLKRAITIDWKGPKITVGAPLTFSIFHPRGERQKNEEKEIPLVYSRFSNHHYYSLTCIKIDPYRATIYATTGTDGFVLLWLFGPSSVYRTYPRRNHNRENFYYTEEALSNGESDNPEDLDVRSVSTLQMSDEDEPNESELDEREVEETAEALQESEEAAPIEMQSAPALHRQESTSEIELAALVDKPESESVRKVAPSPVLHTKPGADTTQQDKSGSAAAAMPTPAVDLCAKKLFCNRTLDMRNINAIGFVMEGLVRYTTKEFSELIHCYTMKKLVKYLSYPEKLLHSTFNGRFMIRGLVLDMAKGNILKSDKNNKIEVAYHGLTKMSKEQIVEDYGNDMQHPHEEPDYAITETVFSMLSANIFAQLVDFADMDNDQELPTGRKYRLIYRDVRQVVDMAIRDGSLKEEVQQNTASYIHKDTTILPMLKAIKKSGFFVFLVTNSLWDYTDVVMNYLCTSSIPDVDPSDTHKWVQHFDVVMTGCLNPAFVNESYQVPLLMVELDSGKLLNVDLQPLDQTSRVFQGGNASQVEILLGVTTGSQILYVSGNMQDDLLPIKQGLGWRTMLVIPELENEINIFSDSTYDREVFEMLKKERLKAEEGIRKLKLSPQYQALSDDDALVDLESILKDRLVQLNHDHEVAYKIFQQKFDIVWGQLMKARNQTSRYAQKVNILPCLYTSHAANLSSYDMSGEYVPREDYARYELDVLGM